jgi:hypothetical protein
MRIRGILLSGCVLIALQVGDTCHNEASADGRRSEVLHHVGTWQERLIADDRGLQPVAR